jgi:prepilin-type processing-associated H-X9-DG protein
MNDQSDDRHVPAEPSTRRSSLPAIGCAFLVCCLVLVPLYHVLPAVRAAREAERRTECSHHFASLGIALEDYHQVYRAFPSPYIPKADGKPMHSWRVSLMMYLNSGPEAPGYAGYDFDVPWDSPKNLQLCKPWSVPVYSCPSRTDLQRADFCTSLVMIVGDETAARPGKWTRLADLEDPASTVLLAEVADSDVFWAEPRDLQFDTMSFRINDPAGNCISSRHLGGAHVLMADGSVRFLADDTEPTVVRALIMRDKGDNLPP